MHIVFKKVAKRFGAHTLFENLSFVLREGEALALMGKSGTGKSTLAKLMIQLEKPSAGAILYNGTPFNKSFRRKIQMVFQNPTGSLNPKLTIRSILQEPGEIHGFSVDVEKALAKVFLPKSYLDRFPKELSGGEKQRVSLARSLILSPEVLILDEAVASLDPFIAYEMVELLKEVQGDMSYFFISHQKKWCKMIADRVLTLDQGALVVS